MENVGPFVLATMATATLNLDLHRIIRLIPGYDPFAQAGDCWFDEEAAQFHIDFIQECCTFTQGERAGQPFILEPWQKAIVANLHGWKWPDGTRRYRRVFIMLGRGNGKSEFGAALVIDCMYLDDEPGSQLYSAAAKRDQTRFVFDPVRKMISNCPDLAARAEIYKHAIIVGDASYKAISREATTEHGGSTQLALVDEVHAQPDRELIDVLETSMVKRRQPLIIYLTTSDYERDGSICNELHTHACHVRDNIVPDPRFLPVIYEASKDEDWASPETWKKANPNLGVSIKESDLADFCEKAKNLPSFLNTFKRLHLNIRTDQDISWIPREKWDACTTVKDPITWRKETIARLKGATCDAAFDLGSTSDICALALLFTEGEKYTVLPYFWIPGQSARKREERDRVPYTVWIRQGFITPTAGVYDEVTDFEFVRKGIVELGSYFSFVKNETNHHPEVAMDRLFQGDQMATWLAGDGFEVVAFGQGFLSMAAPSKRFEELVIAGLIEHGANPVLRWMVSNAAAEIDAAGNVKPSKKKSTERIDGVVALLMALGRAMTRKGKKPSVYKKRGALFL